MRELFIKKNESECIRILEICKTELKKYGIDFSVEDMRSPCRKAHLAFTRSIIALYLYKRGLSYGDIAIILNRKSHASAWLWIKYGQKRGIPGEWAGITEKISFEMTSSEIDEKINWHKEQLIKLVTKKKELQNKK